MLRYALSLIFLLLSFKLLSQVNDSNRISIHQAELEYHDSIDKGAPPETGKFSGYPSDLTAKGAWKLPRMVLGWHPYWASSSAHQYYDYNVLSHIAYFSYEVDTATGGYLTIHGWNTTPLIDYAHVRGTKVLLTVTNFGTSNTKLLSDSVKQKNLINNLITLIKSRNGDGVNFDLESVSSTQKANLVSFMRRAVRLIRAVIPSAEISMATPAVDWSGSWDFKSLSEICDYLIIMGYDYYWSSSSTAGPVAPLTGENYNVTKSVTTYLSSGVSPGKLALGVPWYGYDWPVTGEGRKSTATGKATARIYSAAQQIGSQYHKVFDELTLVPRVSYFVSNAWRQMWYEDTLSLSLKYQLADSKDLAGIGIWALSYEGSYGEVWNTIRNAFVRTSKNTTGILKVYPNPVTADTKIEYSLSSGGNVNITIYDLTGRKRIVLADDTREAGVYTAFINPASLGQGVYICVLTSGRSRSICKLVVPQ